MTPARDRYVLISPCRDEALYARRTLDSVAAQTLQPSLWIVVDDGSTDETPEILEEYAGKLEYMRVIRRRHRPEYRTVCHVEREAYAAAGLVRRMEENPRIGTCSGKPYFIDPRNGQLVSEKCGDETSVGMTKLYRVECFREIGGFVRQVMWDGIDCHRCRMEGWIARSWDDPDLRFVHLRPIGSSDRGWWRGRMRHGFGQYFMGTGIVYMTASALFRMTRPPFILGGLAMWWGYVSSWLLREPRYNDREFSRFLRRYQRNCLLLGKKRATERLDARMAAAKPGKEGRMVPVRGEFARE